MTRPDWQTTESATIQVLASPAKVLRLPWGVYADPEYADAVAALATKAKVQKKLDRVFV